MDQDARPVKAGHNIGNILRFLGLSAVGILIFFVPVTLRGKSSVPLDHIVTWLHDLLGPLAAWYALGMIWIGAAYPFITGTWKTNRTEMVFSILRILGAGTALMAISGKGPPFLQAPDMLPFLFGKLVIPVGLIVPVGAVFLAFLVSYGLLECIGVLLQPVMRPIWKLPGRSAIDAVASFVGSYSIGLLITGRLYRTGRYSAREAAIIATGFSTVSVSFMLIVARTLNLTPIWTLWFWSTLAVTFAVTAITARLPPLLGMNNEVSDPGAEVKSGHRTLAAWKSGLEAAGRAPRLWTAVKLNLHEGLLMALSILPSIMSVGLIGLLLAKYTPVFDGLGFVFYPLTALFGLDGAMELAKASATGLAEMFLPALLLAHANLAVRFSAGVVSVSGIIFFSAFIPCILSTRIPVNLGHLLAIWFLRVALSLLLAIPIGMLVASQSVG
ncbi:MAG: YjiH family protein [Hyphomicrobiales bacterium]